MRYAAPFVVALTWSVVAAADIPPPPGHVEACSVERQRQAGEECVACSMFFAEPDSCLREHAKHGFTFRCRTRGASTWTEVWCKASGAVGVSSMTDPDAGTEPLGLDASPSTPHPPPTPPGPTPATSSEPAASTSPAPPRAPPSGERTAAAPASSPAVAPDRSGGCGACELGSGRVLHGAPIGWASLLALLGLRRKRRFSA